MDLFEEIKDMLGCEYISDIRTGPKLATAKQMVSFFNLNSYSTKQLQDMTKYLYGVDAIGLSKDEIISFLKSGRLNKKR